MSLARRNAEALLAELQRQQIDTCPGCNASITWTTNHDGTSVEILHPQPPCAGFRSFVERLQERLAAAPPEPDFWGVKLS